MGPTNIRGEVFSTVGKPTSNRLATAINQAMLYSSTDMYYKDTETYSGELPDKTKLYNTSWDWYRLSAGQAMAGVQAPR